MYRILYDDRTLFDPYGADDEVVSDATLESGENASSYFDFTMSVKHPLYNTVAERAGLVRVYWDGNLLFEGVIESIETDIELNKTVSCIGPLDYLNDTVVRPYSTIEGAQELTAPSSLEGYFSWLIDRHNSRVLDASKRFSIGVNQASSLKESAYITAESTSYPTTASELTSQILDVYGGHLFLRYEGDEKMLDLYADVHETNAQIIDFGINITDFTKTLDTKDQYTALIVQGGSPTFENGDFENEFVGWDRSASAYIVTDQVHAGSRAAAFNEGAGSLVNDSFFYLKNGWRYKATIYVKNERSANVTVHAGYQRYDGASWGDYSIGGSDSLSVPNDGEWHEFSIDFLPQGSENDKIRPRWWFDDVGEASGGRVIVDDCEFTRIDGKDSVSEDPIDLSLIPDGTSKADSDIFKTGDVIYSISRAERYGYKEKTYSDDSIVDIDELLDQGIIQLRKLMEPLITIDVNAVDLSLYMEGYSHLIVGQAVRVRSKPHDVDEYLTVNSITLDLQDPGKTEYVLGTSYDSLTGQQSGYLKSLNAGINHSLDSVTSLDQTLKDQAIVIGSIEEVANDAKDTADNAQNTANSAQQAAQDAQNSASSALDKAEAVEGAVSEIQGMVDDINSGAEQAKQDAAQAKADAQQAAAKADAASEAAQAAADKADAFEGQITDITTTVNGVAQDVGELTTSVSGAVSIANEALSTATTASQDLEGFKTTVSQTYQLKGDYATNSALDDAIAQEVLNRNSAIEQSAESITSTVSQTYATKTDLAVTDGKATQAQSAASQAQNSASAAQSTANQANQTANGVADDLTDYMETVATTYASKSELEQTSESITATVEANYTEVKQLANTAQSTADSALSKANEASGELADFTESVTGDLADLQDQIDGNIATWFYAGTPTLTNEPAVNWTTTEEKNQHLGDLYYDTNNGYAWRFMVQNGSYSWGRITDSDVTKALEDAANAQDTADSKRRVFVSQPTPPYDVGDLWVQGENGDILRCATPRASGSYNASDWVLASKYTDDSALEIFEGQVADIYSTKAELETATDSITATVEENFEKSVLVKEADGGVVDCGDTAGMPLAGLTVYGQTRQNLWANPSGTSNGLTVTANEDGSITLSGTPTSLNQVNISTYALRPGSTYTVSKDVETTGVSFRIQSYDSGGSFLRNEVEASSWGNVETFTLHDDAAYVHFGVSAAVGQAVSGTYRVMLNEGSEAQPWCPPGLNSVDELSVVCAGKNLLTGTDEYETATGLWATIYASYIGVPRLESGDKITLSGEVVSVSNVSSIQFRLNTWNNEKTANKAATDTVSTAVSVGSRFSITATSNGAFWDIYQFICQISSGTGSITVRDLQLELGSTATAYEPPNVTSTPIDLLGNKVSSLPDGTRDELAVDAAGNVVLKKNTQDLTITSSDGMVSSATESSKWRLNYAKSGAKDGTADYTNAYCDKFNVGSAGNKISALVSSTLHNNAAWASVYVDQDIASSASAAKTIVDAQRPFELIYTPDAMTTIPLGTVDLPALPEQNAHVWISTGTQGLDPDIHATWYAENASALKNFASKAELKVESDQIKATVEETYSTKEEVSAVEDKANAAQDALDSYKETVSTTYATKSSVTQTANSIKQEVSETYTTKTDASETYATKTSLSTVEQTVDGLKSTVSSNYTTLNDKFSSYYTKTEVDQKDSSITLTAQAAQKTANTAVQYALRKSTVDLSSLNSDTWYPVVGSGIPYDGYRTFQCNVQLNSGTKPSWSTHNGGFTVNLQAKMKAFGWGTVPSDGIGWIEDDSFSFCSTSPASINQMGNSSKPVFYLRGGGKYFLFTDYETTWTIHTSSYTASSQTVSPQSSRPANFTSLINQQQDHKDLASLKVSVDSIEGRVESVEGDVSTVTQTANSLTVRLDTAEGNISAAQTTANAAKTAAANAQTAANNAAKTATNYLKFDSTGLVVGNHTTTLTGNTQITSSGVNIRNGSTALATFSASKIELGKNSTSSVIDLCNGRGYLSSGVLSSLTGTAIGLHSEHGVAFANVGNKAPTSGDQFIVFNSNGNLAVLVKQISIQASGGIKLAATGISTNLSYQNLTDFVVTRGKSGEWTYMTFASGIRIAWLVHGGWSFAANARSYTDFTLPWTAHNRNYTVLFGMHGFETTGQPAGFTGAHFIATNCTTTSFRADCWNDSPNTFTAGVSILVLDRPWG